MHYRQLGNSGIQVSPLCLGTMMFGGQTNEYTARAITGRAFEQGINFIDTAMSTMPVNPRRSSGA